MIDLKAMKRRDGSDLSDNWHQRLAELHAAIHDRRALLAYVDELLAEQYETSSIIADYRHAAGEQGATIVGLRAELNALREAVQEMHAAEAEYGCGFYADKRWLAAYRRTKELVGEPK